MDDPFGDVCGEAAPFAPAPLAAAASMSSTPLLDDDSAASSFSSHAAAAAPAPAPPAPARQVTDVAALFSTVEPLRRADPPSLFSLTDPDPLAVILSFALIDVPILTGRPYFPKELIRIIHEYTQELSFVVELKSDSGKVARSVLGSTHAFVQWLGQHLPKLALQPDEDEADESCLMDEDIRATFGADISRLLHAQLEPNEYRMCYLDVPEDEGFAYDPAEFADEDQPVDFDPHERFCLDALNQRKAAIVARGQTPVAVGLNELLNRVRSALNCGRLPRGLTPRLSDWAPLYGWIHDSERDVNTRRPLWSSGRGFKPPWIVTSVPALRLSAVTLQTSSTESALVRQDRSEALLWSYDDTDPVLFKSAVSMIIDDDGEEEEQKGQAAASGFSYAAAAAAAASSSSSSAAAATACSVAAGASPLSLVAAASSSSAAAAMSLSADEEAAARGVPRPRRS